MLILYLSILAFDLILFLYAQKQLEKAAAVYEQTKVIAEKHNPQLKLLKDRVEAIDLAKLPCEKCGHANKVWTRK